MPTKCANCSLRRRDLFQSLTADEVRFMQRFKVGELVVDAGTPILMEGSNSPQLYTALHGMGLRYKLLANGKRQVLNMIFPGDFIGMQAGIMGQMGHSVEATTKMTLCVFDRSEMWTFFKESPQRAFSLTWLAAVEEHFMGDALSTVGQRSALQGLAWVLARVYIRAQALGMVDGATMKFPFKQQDVADLLGLSLVHTNKTLAQLKAKQLAHWSDGTLRVPDLQALADVALLDDTDPTKRPIM